MLRRVGRPRWTMCARSLLIIMERWTESSGTRRCLAIQQRRRHRNLEAGGNIDMRINPAVVIPVTSSSIRMENNTFWHVITGDFLRTRGGQGRQTSLNNIATCTDDMAKISAYIYVYNMMMMGKLCGQNTRFPHDTPASYNIIRIIGTYTYPLHMYKIRMKFVAAKFQRSILWMPISQV